MFCQSCGVSCNSTANFCNTCGASLKNGDKSNITKKLPSNTSSPTVTLSFEEFLERRATSNQSNDQEQTFNDIQKRKSKERTKSIKRKKDEIVKVSVLVTNTYFITISHTQ